jgi:hypothetical protein
MAPLPQLEQNRNDYWRLQCRFASWRKETGMAKNTGDDYRKGAVSGRTQFQRPDGKWVKRDERTGQIVDHKKTDGPYKGVAKEPDGRDTPNS